MAAKVLAFINYKGGVAKTTSAYHVGCWLAGLKNKRVLLIDIDPQTNLTFLCASTEDWQRRKDRVGTIATMYKRYLDGNPIDTKRYLWENPIRLRDGRRHPRLDLVPCDIELIGEDIAVGQIAGVYPSLEMLRKNARQFLRDRDFLVKAIHEVQDKYDYVLIDCPPNLYLMTQNALVASHHYIVTAIPDHLSTIGLNILIRKVNEIGELMTSAAGFAGRPADNHRVAELGAVLFVRVRIGGAMQTIAHASKMEEVRSTLGTRKCFDTHTTELIGYTEAAEYRLPIWFHDSDNARRASQKQEYPNIVDEILEMF
ncbi:MAG: AAA family ATPase [Gemmatimonadota bacterium]|nr:AAA family ATPase [Gemmatimonadota bacterium]